MKISIITINYNDAVGLKRTIKSVISQTFQDKEFLIIDGLSTDGSVDVIKQYSDHISNWVSEHDTGIYNAMNKGIRMATGDYCIFLNSGDSFFSNKVLENAQHYLKTGKDIYNGNSLYIKNGSKIIWYCKGEKDNSLLFFFNSSICHQASFIKTSVVLKYKYDENLKMVADWKFWLEAICLNHASYEAIDLDVCCFDVGGITSTHRDLGLQERRKVLSELLSPDEVAKYDNLSAKRNICKYIRKGLYKNFWLYYARLFKNRQVLSIYKID